MAERKSLADRKAEALVLRKAGRSAGAIAKHLGFRDATTVDRIVAEQLRRDAPANSELSWHALELARVDDLQVKLTKKLANGERGIERELMKLMDYRLRLQSAQHREPGKMHLAVQRALEGLDLVEADEAAKQSALDMATMIDVAMSVGTADDQRRAINAMATMRNLLNDLGASPAARDEVDGITRGARTGPAAGGDEDRMPEKGAEVLSFMERAALRMKGA